MMRMYVVCEGSTEESFVNALLLPHFSNFGVYLFTRTLHGASTYGKIKRLVETQCKTDPRAVVTTLVDFYGFPKKDFPHVDYSGNDPIAKISAYEKAFGASIDKDNFIPNIVSHEFEGLLFSAPESFSALFGRDVSAMLLSVRNQFPSPEHINDGPETAPSKRILRLLPSYDKVLHGSQLARMIGLEAIRRECSRFDAWLRHLERLAARGGAYDGF